MTVLCRQMLDEDRQFVVSGWSASQRMTRDIPLIEHEDWATIWHPVVRKALNRTGVQTIVAVGAVQWGFITFEPPQYVYYVYVAQPFRKRGTARRLFAAAGIDPRSRFGYACRTLASWECRDKMPQAHYDPFHARFSPEANHARDSIR